MRPVDVVPYGPQWPRLFREAEAPLRQAFSGNLLALHHIGSTAIPGMPAKPVIDMLAVVKEIEDVDEAAPALEKMGYSARGENSIPGRRYFTREEGGRRTHHLHVYREGHPAVVRHLAFRDYLIEHPDEAKRYGELKVKLAGRHRDERRRYAEGKEALIAELEEKAMVWRREGG